MNEHFTDKMVFVVILLASTIMLKCHGYVHINSMKTYQQTSPKNDSLFGFSVAYQPRIRRLIITAPHENDIGQVYSTDLNSSNIVKVTPNPLPRRDSNITHDFWLGATVKANSDFFVTCATRYAEKKKNKINNKIKSSSATVGFCFLYEYIDTDKYEPKRFQPMSPAVRDKDIKKFGDQMDSMGWSIALTEHGQVLIGSPAMMIGRVILYKNLDWNPILIRRVAEEVQYNYGYSLTIGRFFNQTTVYAISATFGYGKVYFFDSKPRYMGIIKGTEVGSMFGAALCATRLGAGALLVGAPTYSDSAYKRDTGAVYVYVDQTDEGSKQMLYKRTIKGTSSGSYFGHAIEKLGDIDGDQKDEIVIAAPFENGIGVVYIYSGASILDERTPPRRIQPKNFQSFGFSLTVLEDTDGNGCNELAIGSPKDNKVVVFNTFASITIALSAALHQKIKDSDKDYVLNYCIESHFKQENITADLTITIELRNAKFTTIESKNGVYQFILLLRSTKNCQELDLHVMTDESKTSDNKLIMSYNITASLKEDPEKMSKFDPSRVLLSDQSVLNAYGEKWNYDTSIDEPKLNLDIFSSITEPYMIGSSDLESFTLSVVNTGGAATKQCVKVSVEGARVVAYPRSCTRVSDGLLCRHNQIIRTGGVWENDFKIDTYYLTSINRRLTILCDLYPQCGGDNKKSYDKSFELKPYNNMVEIKGQSNPYHIVNMTTEDLRSGKSLEHVYTIYNYGLTNWVGVKSELILESSPYIDYSKSPIKIYTYTSSTECEIGTSREDEKIRVFCEIGNMKRQEKAVVVIAIAIVPEILVFDGDNQNVTVTTSLNLLLQDGDKYLSLNTTLKFTTAEVPLWVTLAASFVGMFLIIIIAYILYEQDPERWTSELELWARRFQRRHQYRYDRWKKNYGFLRRKTKDKLNEKKQELYRQSVHRAMGGGTRAVVRRERDREFKFQKQEDEDSV